MGGYSETRCSGRGGTSEAYVCMYEERTFVGHTALMGSEMRVHQTSAQRAAWQQTAHVGKWGGSS